MCTHRSQKTSPPPLLANRSRACRYTQTGDIFRQQSNTSKVEKNLFCLFCLNRPRKASPLSPHRRTTFLPLLAETVTNKRRRKRQKFLAVLSRHRYIYMPGTCICSCDLLVPPPPGLVCDHIYHTYSATPRKIDKTLSINVALPFHPLK